MNIRETRFWQQIEAIFSGNPDAQYFYGIVTGREGVERFELNKELYKAFRNREFCLFYQPVFSVSGAHLTGVEALLRWRHPLRGLLSPSAFFPSLEESGLVVPVGEWVVKEACMMGRTLSDVARDPVCVSVNVSARQMADSGFHLSVLDALYDTGIEPSLLQLEFSEQVIARSLDTAQHVLQELRDAGVRVAIDQFAAGRLAVADLVRVPASAIKIDRSLVAGVGGDPLVTAIISATSALANSSGRDVAAVGIEYPPQMDLLAQMGCGEAQGTLLSQPQTAAELLNRVRV